MNPETRRLTNWHATVAAVVSFFTQPIPGADEFLVIPIHYWFTGKVARQRGVKIWKAPWKPVNKIIWGGAVARLGANFTLGLVPVAGAFSNAITAVALTEYLARYLDHAFEHPDEAPPEVSLRELKKTLEAAFAKRKDKGA